MDYLYLNLWECMSAFAHHLQVDLDGKTMIFSVPKFHLPTHIASCQTSSFNLIPKIGHMDGEAPECGCANINPVWTSTKQMGPASCQETIDDHFGNWNHKKVIGWSMSHYLYMYCLHYLQVMKSTTPLHKLKSADKVKDEHVMDYLEFTDSLLKLHCVYRQFQGEGYYRCRSIL